ncbi:MFS transporter [Allosaccharopolyspora coralli]|uniref:MFS transporter n=2 Tax=Allosaccharopolyspora coralli TaxID=2665642 RepID=A0A5Q3QK62_9PSEU|nr:MFS transporter [Allosaccharopolyspora coralli]
MFDGYDIVVYGTVLPQFLEDPSLIGPVDPALGGALGSYALLGVLVGALLAGSIGDVVGRRKLMIGSVAWFGVGMAITAFTSSTTAFGLLRFGTGLGVGALLAITAATVAEFAPPGKKNLANAIVYGGVPLGSLLAALLAILLLPVVGWRGMFLIGALPLVTLVPLMLLKIPESVAWLAARGRLEEARAVSARTGVPVPNEPAAEATRTSGSQEDGSQSRAGFAGLVTRTYLLPTIVLGFTSATGLLLVYSLNTWLPRLMETAGFSAEGSLTFLLILNGGAIVGALFGSRVADRFGAKRVVAACFFIGAVSLALLTTSDNLALLLPFVAIVGLGTSGTQTLIYGFVANYYRTEVRGAGVAWCAGFGRLGGVAGPTVGGLLVAAGLSLNGIFYILAAIALAGMVLALTVPERGARDQFKATHQPDESRARP